MAVMRYTMEPSRSFSGGWHIVWAIDHSTHRAPVFAEELRTLQGVPEVNEDVHGHYITHDVDTALDVMNLLNRLAAALTLVDVDYDPMEGPLRHQFRRRQPYADSCWW